MIIVVCKDCNSEDLKKGPYSNTFFCNCCNKTKELYQIGFKVKEAPKVFTNFEQEYEQSREAM